MRNRLREFLIALSSQQAALTWGINVKDYGERAMAALSAAHDVNWFKGVAEYAHVYVFWNEDKNGIKELDDEQHYRLEKFKMSS